MCALGNLRPNTLHTIYLAHSLHFPSRFLVQTYCRAQPSIETLPERVSFFIRVPNYPAAPTPTRLARSVLPRSARRLNITE